VCSFGSGGATSPAHPTVRTGGGGRSRSRCCSAASRTVAARRGSLPARRSARSGRRWHPLPPALVPAEGGGRRAARPRDRHRHRAPPPRGRPVRAEAHLGPALRLCRGRPAAARDPLAGARVLARLPTPGLPRTGGARPGGVRLAGLRAVPRPPRCAPRRGGRQPPARTDARSAGQRGPPDGDPAAEPGSPERQAVMIAHGSSRGGLGRLSVGPARRIKHKRAIRTNRCGTAQALL
jgi:hypothetical protein